MGQVKQFGFELAELIYEADFDDEEMIVSIVTSRPRPIFPNTKLEQIAYRLIRKVFPEFKTRKLPDSPWLREQIRFVQEHPESWNHHHPAYPGYPVDIPEPNEDV